VASVVEHLQGKLGVRMGKARPDAQHRGFTVFASFRGSVVRIGSAALAGDGTVLAREKTHKGHRVRAAADGFKCLLDRWSRS